MAKPVSPETLARFKEGFECWNRDELDLMQGMYAEEGVFDLSAVFPDAEPIQGHQNMRRYWIEMQDTWAGIRTDPLEAFDLGGGLYVVDLRLRGQGQQSGVDVDQRFAMLYTIRTEDEKIVRAQLFPDVAAAISAAESSRSQAAGG
ncbi:MAG: nuclear transport factor 2 family protein [Actinomycetota bacterium]|nr:nuclear transport factor 2 family protein [Actinomycetota bacterium]